MEVDLSVGMCPKLSDVPPRLEDDSTAVENVLPETNLPKEGLLT